eukprot:227104-Pleurochrysis_carterae.AAC.2
MGHETPAPPRAAVRVPALGQAFGRSHARIERRARVRRTAAIDREGRGWRQSGVRGRQRGARQRVSQQGCAACVGSWLRLCASGDLEGADEVEEPALEIEDLVESHVHRLDLHARVAVPRVARRASAALACARRPTRGREWGEMDWMDGVL